MYLGSFDDNLLSSTVASHDFSFLFYRCSLEGVATIYSEADGLAAARPGSASTFPRTLLGRCSFVNSGLFLPRVLCTATKVLVIMWFNLWKCDGRSLRTLLIDCSSRRFVPISTLHPRMLASPPFAAVRSYIYWKKCGMTRFRGGHRY